MLLYAFFLKIKYFYWISLYMGNNYIDSKWRNDVFGYAHRDLRRALYMAKPSIAQTVAPTLALSQNVELFKSAWVMCLKKEMNSYTQVTFVLLPYIYYTAFEA